MCIRVKYGTMNICTKSCPCYCYVVVSYNHCVVNPKNHQILGNNIYNSTLIKVAITCTRFWYLQSSKACFCFSHATVTRFFKSAIPILIFTPPCIRTIHMLSILHIKWTVAILVFDHVNERMIKSNQWHVFNLKNYIVPLFFSKLFICLYFGHFILINGNLIHWMKKNVYSSENEYELLIYKEEYTSYL